MIITFCGHSDFVAKDGDKDRFLKLLESLCGREDTDFYLGGYGSFDLFCLGCCKEFKRTHENATVTFVTPYMDEKYLKDRKDGYDKIIYPELEKLPPRYAISYRNRYMVDKADVVVCFIKRSFGGAYKAYSYAKKKDKKIISFC